MSKVEEAGSRHLAHAALVAAESISAVGTFIEAKVEEEGTTTYLFEANLKGYVGWRWSVTLAQTSRKDAATVSEIVLVPGPESITAPDWVPWSERLADYKALQAELERQAAEEAAEAGEVDDESETEDDVDADESESEEVDEAESAEESEESAEAKEAEAESVLATDVPESVDAEAEASNASPKRPGLFGRKRWLKRK